jgi:hypothetical protein
MRDGAGHPTASEVVPTSSVFVDPVREREPHGGPIEIEIKV